MPGIIKAAASHIPAVRLRSRISGELTAHNIQMKKRGRKSLIVGETMKRTVVSLDETTLRKLRVLGENNLSRGVRLAAEVAYDRYQRSS